MWRKKLIQKESGTTQHHYGAAAKAIEGERQRKAAEDAMRTRIAAETAVKTAAEDTAAFRQRRRLRTPLRMRLHASGGGAARC